MASEYCYALANNYYCLMTRRAFYVLWPVVPRFRAIRPVIIFSGHGSDRRVIGGDAQERLRYSSNAASVLAWGIDVQRLRRGVSFGPEQTCMQQGGGKPSNINNNNDGIDIESEIGMMNWTSQKLSNHKHRNDVCIPTTGRSGLKQS
jgi:hypothetical protein